MNWFYYTKQFGQQTWIEVNVYGLNESNSTVYSGHLSFPEPVFKLLLKKYKSQIQFTKVKVGPK